jgi:hypothetical protein
MRVGITVDDPGTVVAEARRAEAHGFDFLVVVSTSSSTARRRIRSQCWPLRRR